MEAMQFLPHDIYKAERPRSFLEMRTLAKLAGETNIGLFPGDQQPLNEERGHISKRNGPTKLMSLVGIYKRRSSAQRPGRARENDSRGETRAEAQKSRGTH
jgi:hypothetical protein